MDKILVLHKRRLDESGTHQELFAHRGIYFKPFELRYSDARESKDVRILGSKDLSEDVVTEEAETAGYRDA